MNIAKNECKICMHHTICKYESGMKAFVDRISETISKENTNIMGIVVESISIRCNSFASTICSSYEETAEAKLCRGMYRSDI